MISVSNSGDDDVLDYDDEKRSSFACVSEYHDDVVVDEDVRPSDARENDVDEEKCS